MVTSCSASGCTNRHHKSSFKRFHGFPLNNPELLMKWIIATKRKNFFPNSNSKLCSDHFTDNDYSGTGRKGKGRWLNAEAVPSIFPTFEPKVKKQKLSKRSSAATKNLKDNMIVDNEDIEPSVSPEVLNSNQTTLLQGGTKKTGVVIITPENNLRIENIQDYPSSPSENVVSSSTSLSFSKDSNVNQEHNQKAVSATITSEIVSSIENYSCTSSHAHYCPAARQRIMGLKKSIKTLNQKIRRYKKKISNLENLVNKLKSRKSQDDQLERLLHQFSDNESFIEILKNMIRNHTKKSARFSVGMRKFAEALYAKSSKAYLFCKPILKLPSQKLVHCWISKTMTDYFNIIDGVVTGAKKKDQNSSPIEECISKNEKRTRSTQKRSSSTQKCTSLTKKRICSVQKQSSPIQKNNSPIQEQSSPLPKDTSPIIESTCIQKQTFPIQNENSFTKHQNSPVQGQICSLQEQFSPILNQNSPIQNDNNLILNLNSPLLNQKSPLLNQNSPIIQGQSSPMLDEASSIEELTSSILQEFEKDKMDGHESCILHDFENDMEDSLYVLRELEDIAVQDLPLQEFERAPNISPPQVPEQVELHILTDDQYEKGSEQQTIALPVTPAGNIKLGVPVTILHCGKLITAYPFA